MNNYMNIVDRWASIKVAFIQECNRIQADYATIMSDIMSKCGQEIKSVRDYGDGVWVKVETIYGGHVRISLGREGYGHAFIQDKYENNIKTDNHWHLSLKTVEKMVERMSSLTAEKMRVMAETTLAE